MNDKVMRQTSQVDSRVVADNTGRSTLTGGPRRAYDTRENRP